MSFWGSISFRRIRSSSCVGGPDSIANGPPGSRPDPLRESPLFNPFGTGEIIRRFRKARFFVLHENNHFRGKAAGVMNLSAATAF
jgi:hypothetical protein